MDDPFENMREQMEKDRDQFFRNVNPRDWPNDNGRGSMFNRVSKDTINILFPTLASQNCYQFYNENTLRLSNS